MKSRNVITESPLLSSAGWRDCIDSRLLRAAQNWQEAQEFKSHGHTLRRLFIDLTIDAVLCVEGRPTVCVKDSRRMSPSEVEDLRRRLWNMGATVLLVTEGTRDIKVYSTLFKPAPDDQDGNRAQLSHETIQSLELAELALRLGQLINRVETGEIYRENKPLFDPQSAVDRTLLENLRSLRDKILSGRSRQDYQQAHAFIGRFLFSSYLLDRGIIRSSYLQKAHLPEAEDMANLLEKAADGPQVLETLFSALQRDFNGSLFGNLLDNHKIDGTTINYLRRFLAGDDLASGQLSLFKLYDFSFIPVELISCIYEEFLGAEAKTSEGAVSSVETKRGTQRALGAYYTPPRLAELVVDIATEGWDTLLNKRCLDPACGSGIFLVIMFIRMAEEWRKRNPRANTRRRYEELMRLLSENLRGIDTHPTACLVTCFSLYLAFLDQMDPKEIIDLREALASDGMRKILPRILWKNDDTAPKPPHFATVRESDFFEVTAEKEFDLVIGNPPWVSHHPAQNAYAWLFSATTNPYLSEMQAKTKREQLGPTLIPAHELAIAFMWKAGLHLRPGGRVCQILPSRVFLSNNTDRFQAAWIRKQRLEVVWLLADWRRILFPSATCPCVISRYQPRDDGELLGVFDFVTPKAELLDPREALIPIFPEDRKTLFESDIVSAAERGEAAAAWKKQHWGTPRDLRLLERLLRMPRLNRMVNEPPRNPGAAANPPKYCWYKGQGFQPASASTKTPHQLFWKRSDLFLSANSQVSGLVLSRDECKPVGELYENAGLHRAKIPLLFKAPLLLINKACTKFLFSDFDVLFQDDFQSICAPKEEEDELLFLTAVFSSSLAQYFLFHTTANIGIERDIARLEEILALPFPLPRDTDDPARSRRIVLACAECLRKLRGQPDALQNRSRRKSLVLETQKHLNKLVYEYFTVCDWERQLIEDTVNMFRPSSTPGSLDSKKLLTVQRSTPTHREEYAETLIKTFRGWSRVQKALWTQCALASDLGLALITLGIGGRSREYKESPSEPRVASVLEKLRDVTARDGSVARVLRGFVLYEPDRVHILKPLARRHWTNTAALNDADEILTRMMEEDGWRD